jgi:hypothetical protein
MAGRGFEITHLRSNGQAQPEAHLVVEETRKSPPTLFAIAWRSAVPLRHKTFGRADEEE